MSGIVPTTSRGLTLSTLTTTVGGKDSYDSHPIDEETETWKE